MGSSPLRALRADVALRHPSPLVPVALARELLLHLEDFVYALEEFLKVIGHRRILTTFVVAVYVDYIRTRSYEVMKTLPERLRWARQTADLSARDLDARAGLAAGTRP
jgi:hypothetical protein